MAKSFPYLRVVQLFSELSAPRKKVFSALVLARPEQPKLSWPKRNPI